MTLSKQKKAKTIQTRTSDVTRDRILDVAKHLFSKQGFAKTSTRQIALGAKCNISLIVYHFGGKEGLLDAVAKSVASGVSKKLSHVLTENRKPKQNLHSIVDFLVDYLYENSPFLNIIFKAYLPENRPLPPLFVEQIQQNAASAVAIFDKMKKEGTMRTDLDSRTTAALFMGMVMFQMIASPMLSKVIGPRTPENINLLKRTIESVFLNGILTTHKSGEKHP